MADLPTEANLQILDSVMIGTTVSHYQILEKLGEGGMGVVYKAQDTKLDRHVALKFLPHNISASQQEKARFLQEAKAAASLNHPNICTIYGIEEHDGEQFIVMEYVDGETMRRKIAGRGEVTSHLQVNDAIMYATQIGEALSAAHEKEIAHRDIKPDNIMVNSKNQIKVMDFGLAKLKGGMGLTRSQSTLGTTAYMSPEQMQSTDVDHRTDIWSFGVVLYEMLTGRLPFRGEHQAAMVYSITNEKPQPILSFRADIPRHLQAILERALEKDKTRRYQIIQEVLSDLKQPASTISSVKQEKSIVVLPFKNVSAEKDTEYFSDGLTEEIINSLTRIKDLHVVARTSAFSFKGKEVDVREIGRKLGVVTLLEGSVRKAGNHIRITAQLVNVDDGYHLWSERYDRKLDDVFAIQDEISLQIVNTLKIKLESGEKEIMVKRYTEDVEAYNLYAKGRYFQNKITEEGFRRGIEYFDQAVKKDPDYALAYGGMADCYAFLGWYYYLPSKEAFPKAKAAAQKALEIDENLSEAHTSLGWVKMIYDRDWTGAEKEFVRAIELDARDANACLFYSFYLAATGRHDESIAEAKRTQRLDPFTPFTTINLAMRFYYARQFDAAIEQIKSLLEMDPNFSMAYYYLAWPYAQKGMLNEALENVTKAMESLGKTTPVLSCLGIVYALLSKKNEANNVLDELFALSKKKFISPYLVAEVHAGLDQKKQAFEWLEKAYEEYDPIMVYLNVDPLLDRLRPDPRFMTLLKKMGLSMDESNTYSFSNALIKPREKSIVVLPFENMSSDKENEYFSDGLTEEIITNLSRISSLKVLSRTSSMHYKGTKKPLKEIAKELAVEYVLEGSVRKQGTDLRITAQLIEAARDAHLWADKYGGTVKDVFDIQEKVAEEIVKALKVQLTDAEDEGLRKRYTENTEAYELYLKGNYNLWLVSPESINKAIEYFELAIAKDAHYAPAYAGLSTCYHGAVWFGYMDPHEALAKGKKYAAKALEIDDTLAEAYVCLGYYNCLDWNWSLAEQQFNRALELKPNNADVHEYYAWYLGGQARIDEAMTEMKRAQELDPLSLVINANASFPYYWKRQYDQAITQCLNTLKLEPTFYLTHWFLGIAYAQAGSYQEAISAFKKAVTFSGGGPYYQAWLGHAYGESGKKEEAVKILEELKQFSTPKRAFSYQIALVHLGLGDNEQAMNWLEKAYEERAPFLWYLKIEPYLDPLRSNPRFTALLRGMGLVKAEQIVTSPASVVITPQEKSIVVIPFENRSPDKDDEYFSDGLTEEIITDLSKIHSLRVISRSSAMKLKGTQKDVKTLGRELNVRYVLEGSVRKAKDTLRITAELVDTATDTQLWAEKYSGTLEDVFDIQEKVSRSIVDSLRLKLSPVEEEHIARRPIQNIHAHECYLRARQEMWRNTEQSLDHAVNLIKNALDIVGDNALLYATLGTVYLHYHHFGIRVDPNLLQEAQECARKSIALDSGCAQGYVVKGIIVFKKANIQEAVRHLKQALTIEATNADALLWLAVCYFISGKAFAARPLAQTLLLVDPLTPITQALPGWIEFFDGQIEKALPYYRRWLNSDPEGPFTRWTCAMVFAANKQIDEFHQVVESLLRDTPTLVFAKHATFFKNAFEGKREAALQVATDNLKREAASNDYLPIHMAAAYALIGESDEAVNWLEHAMRSGFIDYPLFSRHEPFLKSIENYDRFKKLLEDVKKKWEAFEV